MPQVTLGACYNRPMIALTEHERRLIIDIVKSRATDQPYRVLLFGSRAIGRAKKYSDVDLAFVGHRPVPLRIRAALAEAFDESGLPYTVDVVDFHQASQAMQEQIQQQGVEVLGS